MEQCNKPNEAKGLFNRVMVDCRFLADEAMKREEEIMKKTTTMQSEDKKCSMEKVRLYTKPMFVVHLNMVHKLEDKIKDSDALKGKKYDWVGTCTLKKTNPNTNSDYEVGGMALAMFDNEKAIAILPESDMGLVEQFMKELEGYEKIYLFDESDYEIFSKYNEKKIDIIMA